MKKFCFVFLINLILIFSSLSVSNAQHVRVADVGVTNFVKSMQEDIYFPNQRSKTTVFQTVSLLVALLK